MERFHIPSEVSREGKIKGIRKALWGLTSGFLSPRRPATLEIGSLAGQAESEVHRILQKTFQVLLPSDEAYRLPARFWGAPHSERKAADLSAVFLFGNSATR